MTTETTIQTLHGLWPWTKDAQYAQAVRIGDTILTGGQGGFAKDGNLVSVDTAEQTRQTFRNLEAVLAQFGETLDAVAAMTVYIAEPADYEVFKQVRTGFLSHPFPASTAVGVGALLAEGMKVEIQVTAVVGGRRSRQEVTRFQPTNADCGAYPDGIHAHDPRLDPSQFCHQNYCTCRTLVSKSSETRRHPGQIKTSWTGETPSVD
ncbi:RidA family protein [Arthrobacter mobilis]|uniref:RidA family protein n=1 Tax=Arthrobacter mobilis TaxID=2724944 RepID=A0A7X6K5W8_9MICC|nr:RidA family protein [Arthrobacter mobilis]NKX54380.1 RidA family protein [Arthrobacter mobilis]